MTLSASAPHQHPVSSRYVQIVEEARAGLAISGRRFVMTALHNHLNDLAQEDPQDAGCARWYLDVLTA